MKLTILTAAALVIASGAGLQAQTTSSRRIPIRKDTPATSDTAAGSYVPPAGTMTTAMTDMPDTLEWYAPTGTTCSTVDPTAAAAVKIKSDLYDASTMISPDSAKIVALCAVPGQIGSGEMNTGNGRTEYAVDIIPNGKKTHTKVVVDAQTGAVLSSKQFGGLRGLTGWVRESMEHRKNTKP